MPLITRRASHPAMRYAVPWVFGVLLAITWPFSAWAAADSTGQTGTVGPPWATVRSASFHAALEDEVHAQLTTVIGERQFNPLRAARLITLVRLTQWQAMVSAQMVDQVWASRLAAVQAMTWLLPQEEWTRWYAPLLGQADADGAQPTVIRLQNSTAQAVVDMVQHTVNDGAALRRRTLPRPDPVPGIWQRTPPLFAEQPIEPRAAEWALWCPGSAQAHVEPPIGPGDPRWSREVNAVLAARNTLTDAQRSLAQDWNLDAGSITPPGVWNAVAVSFMASVKEAPMRRHAVLAVLNAAMHDALLAAWRVKLTHWTERPLTAVRRELDPSFEPLLVTPPFPGYVSGHATVSAAAAGVLARFYPAQTAQWFALAQQAAESRLHGGIHFPHDNAQGLALGEQVAQACWQALGPIALSARPLLPRAPTANPLGSLAIPSIAAPP